eukprot:UC1_evm1s1035
MRVTSVSLAGRRASSRLVATEVRLEVAEPSELGTDGIIVHDMGTVATGKTTSQAKCAVEGATVGDTATEMQKGHPDDGAEVVKGKEGTDEEGACGDSSALPEDGGQSAGEKRPESAEPPSQLQLQDVEGVIDDAESTAVGVPAGDASKERNSAAIADAICADAAVPEAERDELAETSEPINPLISAQASSS